MITFVRETESLDFAEAVEWLAERFRVTLEYEETSPQLEEARKRRDRLHARARPGGRVLRAAPLGVGRPARRCARTSRAAGLGEAVCREFRLGLSPGSGLAQKARREGLHGATSCAAPA